MVYMPNVNTARFRIGRAIPRGAGSPCGADRARYILQIWSTHYHQIDIENHVTHWNLINISPMSLSLF